MMNRAMVRHDKSLQFCAVFAIFVRHGLEFRTTVCIDFVNTIARIWQMDIRFELNGDTFVWDATKDEQNWNKHGIRFAEAAAVFGDPLFVLMDAARNDEARQAAIGFDATGRLLYVAHLAFEMDCIRLISARRATTPEEHRYAD
jgi:hypothetical protein